MKKMIKKIPKAVVRRLTKYYRYLTELQQKGVERVSSAELSRITGFTASQIRQDLNHFGGFGQQGFGYRVASLKDQVATILGLNRGEKLAIVGIGHLGKAIANSQLFTNRGYRLAALFDSSPDKIGKSLRGIEIIDVKDLEETCRKLEINILTITTPPEHAQEVAEAAARAGIQGIWNFAYSDLVLPKGVVIENVSLEESLHTLTYYIHNPHDYREN